MDLIPKTALNFCLESFFKKYKYCTDETSIASKSSRSDVLCKNGVL